MNTASPRIPSPLDTAGMMAVVSAPGLARLGTAQRGQAGGDREEKDPRQRQRAEPAAAGGGRAGGRAGGLEGRSTAPSPSPLLGRLRFHRPLAQVTAAHTRALPRSLAHWPQDKGTPLRLVQRPAISVWEEALPKRRAEFDYVRWDRPLRAAGSGSDWIRTLSRERGIDVKEGVGAGSRR